MKRLHVTLYPLYGGELGLSVKESTTIPEICEFVAAYSIPTSFSTAQQMAQKIVREFADMPDGEVISVSIL